MHDEMTEEFASILAFPEIGMRRNAAFSTSPIHASRFHPKSNAASIDSSEQRMPLAVPVAASLLTS